MGDVVCKGFQCLNAECTNFNFVGKADLQEGFEIKYPTCEMVIRSGDESKFYDYQLVDLRNNSVIQQGEFIVLDDDYVAEAQAYKYCNGSQITNLMGSNLLQTYSLSLLFPKVFTRTTGVICSPIVARVLPGRTTLIKPARVGSSTKLSTVHFSTRQSATVNY